MPCPICTGPHRQVKYQIRGHTLFECGQCGGYYLDDAAQAQAQYEGSYLSQGTGNKESLTGYYDYERELNLHLKTFSQHIDIVKKYKSTGRLLDMGCASGHFLKAADRAGFDVTGVDISSDSIAKLKANFGFEAHAGDIRDMAFAEKFDVITTWETIEHLPEPLSILNALKGLLKEDGILVVGTGNNQSLVSQMMGQRWWYITPPDHCIYYNPTALNTVLTRSGFQVMGEDRVNLHWVSSRNVAQKLCRSFGIGAQSSLKFIRRLPDVGLPIVHGTTMVHIARQAPF